VVLALVVAASVSGHRAAIALPPRLSRRPPTSFGTGVLIEGASVGCGRRRWLQGGTMPSVASLEFASMELGKHR
jgi:hypothetical protein